MLQVSTCVTKQLPQGAQAGGNFTVRCLAAQSVHCSCHCRSVPTCICQKMTACTECCWASQHHGNCNQITNNPGASIHRNKLAQGTQLPSVGLRRYIVQLKPGYGTADVTDLCTQLQATRTPCSYQYDTVFVGFAAQVRQVTLYHVCHHAGCCKMSLSQTFQQMFFCMTVQ